MPGIVTKDGVKGVDLNDVMPIGFASLLSNRVGVVSICAEAAIHKSRELALQALLVDPCNTNLAATEKLFDTMLDLQSDYLGYLR